MIPARSLHRSPQRSRARSMADLAIAFALLGAGLATLASCTPRGKEETAMLARAVDRVRSAPESDKTAAAAALEAVPCDEQQAICDVKAECVVFAKKTVAGLARKSEVERTLADVQAGKLAPTDPAAEALAGKLDEASALLKEGEAALVECDQRLAHLKSEWHL
jgi:hypothetical protein